jgi:hypothetical protein
MGCPGPSVPGPVERGLVIGVIFLGFFLQPEAAVAKRSVATRKFNNCTLFIVFLGRIFATSPN